AVVAVCVALSTTHTMAANAVDLTDKVKWTCEGDTQVSLDQNSSVLTIVSRSAKIRQSLQFRACHSSHCGWGTGTECYEAPCAEILAGPKGQALSIKLAGFETSCEAVKSEDAQDENDLPRQTRNEWCSNDGITITQT